MNDPKQADRVFADGADPAIVVDMEVGSDLPEALPADAESPWLELVLIGAILVAGAAGGLVALAKLLG